MGENRFVFVITGHKTVSLARECINSIRAQLGSFYFSSLYIDDCSNYSLAEIELLEKWLSQANGKLILLKERHFQIGALSRGIPLIESDNDIVCLVDSDDYLLPHALQTVNEAYQDPNIAMTYGNVLIDFRPYQDTQEKYFYDKKTVNTEYSLEVWKKQSFREDGFRCFHLRTFRRWLWDYIDPKGFRRPNGDFIRASGDSAYMFPILELLADPKHVAFIDTPLYVYRLHEGNVHNHDKKSQSDDLDLLRFKMKKYSPLDRSILRQHLERSACAG
jgi:glycosyltransferase involved in cell wall biosynthesis